MVESLDCQKTHCTKDEVYLIIDKNTTPMNNDELDDEFSQVISCTKPKINLLEIKKIDYFAADNNNFESQDTLLEKETGAIKHCEDQEPLSTLSDKDSKEKAYIKLYDHEKMRDSNKYTYKYMCKSEFRRCDQKAAEDINKLFDTFKETFIKKINTNALEHK